MNYSVIKYEKKGVATFFFKLNKIKSCILFFQCLLKIKLEYFSSLYIFGQNDVIEHFTWQFRIEKKAVDEFDYYV